MSVLSSPRSTLIVLMLVQLTLKLPPVSGNILDSASSAAGSLLDSVNGTDVGDADTASRSVESLIGRAQGIQLGPSILATAAIILGGFMVVFGFRLIRVTLFVIGFVAGGVAIAIVAERMFADEPWVVLGSWIAFGVGGLICGVLVTWMYPLSTFVAGAATGILVAFIVATSFGNMIYPGHTQDLFTLLCVVLGFLFGIFTLKFGKPILIISTSLFGAGLVVWGVGYFAGDFPSFNNLESYLSKDVDGETVYAIPLAWWGYLIGLLVLFVFGVFIQFRKTARNVEDKHKGFFGRRDDVATYVEKKTQREKRNTPAMESPPPRRQRPARRSKPVKEVREQRQPRQVVVRENTAPRTRSKRQESKSKPVQPTSPASHQQQWANLDAQDEVVYYDDPVEQHHHSVIYMDDDRDSDLYDFESNRDPCRFCGDYVHRDGSCCSEAEAHAKRRQSVEY